jgi:hypothetical protein
MEKTISSKTNQTLALGKGLNLLFWGGIFLVLNIKFNDFDILPDLIGHLFAIAGVLYLINGSVLLNQMAKVFTWIVAITVLANFIVYIINFLIPGINNPAWTIFAGILFPIFILSVAYVGYSIAEKLVNKMEKSWKILLYLYTIMALVLVAIQVAFTLQRSFELNSIIVVVAFLIMEFFLGLYSFITIRKTSKELKKSVKQ